MRSLLVLLDLVLSGYLVGVLHRIPEGKVPSLIYWYIAGTFLRGLVVGAAGQRWWYDEVSYARIYVSTLVPLLVLAVAVAARGWKLGANSGALGVGAALLAAGLYRVVSSQTFKGIWGVEAGVLIAVSVVELASLAYDRGLVSNVLALYLGLSWLARGWLLYFFVIGAMRRPTAEMARGAAQWVFPAVSVVLSCALILVLRGQSEGARLLDAESAVLLERSPTAEGLEGAERADHVTRLSSSASAGRSTAARSKPRV